MTGLAGTGRRWVRGAAGLVLAAFCAVAAAGEARADAFTVTGVTVDVRAASAAKAREQALVTGQVEAFSRLVAAVVAEADRSRVPSLSAEAVESLVADLSVTDEKASATRYIATLSVHFDSERVGRMLRDAGIVPIRGSDQTTILLGIYRAADGAPPQLWEETNPWRGVLTQKAVERGLFPTVAVRGDETDQAAAPVDKVLALDPAALDALLARYGADAVVVADARATPEGGVRLSLSRYPRPIPRSVASLYAEPAAEPGAALSLLASDTVLAVARAAKTKSAAGVIVGETDSLAVLLPVKSLADWVRAERTLRALPGVRGVALRAARTDLVQAAVSYVGDAAGLRTQLEKAGYRVEDYHDYWQISPDSLAQP